MATNDLIRVCIIGTGISGLRAAQHLLESSNSPKSPRYDITIIEARDRIGGRIAQVKVPRIIACKDTITGPHTWIENAIQHQSEHGHQQVPGEDPEQAIFDAGACYIHSTEGHPLIPLVEKLGLKTVACGTVCSIYDESGARMAQARAEKVYDAVWEVLGEAMSGASSDSDSLWDWARERVREGIKSGRWAFGEEGNVGHTEDKTKKEEGLIMSVMEMWGAFIGAEPQTQSLKGMFLEQGTSLDQGEEGDNLLVGPTFQSVIKILGNDVLPRVRAVMNTEVKLIESLDRFRLRVSGSLSAASGTVSDTFNETFSHVIITVPIGYLKEHVSSMFLPPLPQRLSRAIANTGVGKLEKILFRFDTAWWDPEGKFPIETLYLSPEYARESNPHGYRQEIISYSALGYPVVLFFVYGEWADHVRKQLRGHEPSSAEYLEVLNTLFEPYLGLLPNYQTGDQCAPVGAHMTNWAQDPYTRGSYSNHTVGPEDTVDDWRVLRGGVGEGVWEGLWFAGEHVAPVKGLGTVAGAWWSGEEAVEKIKGVEAGGRCGCERTAD